MFLSYLLTVFHLVLSLIHLMSFHIHDEVVSVRRVEDDGIRGEVARMVHILETLRDALIVGNIYACKDSNTVHGEGRTE